MSKSRIKIVPPVILSRQAMESLAGEISHLKSQQLLLSATMDSHIQAIRQEYENRVAPLAAALDQKMEAARAWAEANPVEFAGARSIEMVHAIIGWRTGQPTLKPLSGWTWNRVIENLRSAGASAYIRSKEEVNKQQLLADRDVLGQDILRQTGLRVVQEEFFFVEPKLATTGIRETRKT